MTRCHGFCCFPYHFGGVRNTISTRLRNLYNASVQTLIILWWAKFESGIEISEEPSLSQSYYLGARLQMPRSKYVSLLQLQALFYRWLPRFSKPWTGHYPRSWYNIGGNSSAHFCKWQVVTVWLLKWPNGIPIFVINFRVTVKVSGVVGHLQKILANFRWYRRIHWLMLSDFNEHPKRPDSCQG